MDTTTKVLGVTIASALVLFTAYMIVHIGQVVDSSF